MYAPANSARAVGFYALVGTENISLDGEEVVGRWASNLRRQEASRPLRLAEEFANWSEQADQILRFTQKYGPLQEEPQPGAEFHFPMASWQRTQWMFRRVWEYSVPEKGISKSSGLYHRGRGHGWELLGGHLIYRAGDLWELLHLDLYSIPPERLRKCANPECQTPYFVARHLRQHYCTELCAKWGQQRWKRRWWDEHGPEWQAKRQKRLQLEKNKRSKSSGR